MSQNMDSQQVRENRCRRIKLTCKTLFPLHEVDTVTYTISTQCTPTTDSYSLLRSSSLFDLKIVIEEIQPMV